MKEIKISDETYELIKDQLKESVKKENPKLNPFKLSLSHQEVAKKIINKHITKRYLKKGCKHCNLTGIKYITNTEGLVVPCNCVDYYSAWEEWEKYCLDFPELKNRFLAKENT